MKKRRRMAASKFHRRMLVVGGCVDTIGMTTPTNDVVEGCLLCSFDASQGVRDVSPPRLSDLSFKSSMNYTESNIF